MFGNNKIRMRLIIGTASSFPVVTFQLFLLNNAFTGSDSQTTEDSPCHPNPCKNGGVCFPQPDEFFCLCVVGFLGKTCDADTIKMASTSRQQTTTGATTTEAQSTTPRQTSLSTLRTKSSTEETTSSTAPTTEITEDTTTMVSTSSQQITTGATTAQQISEAQSTTPRQNTTTMISTSRQQTTTGGSTAQCIPITGMCSRHLNYTHATMHSLFPVKENSPFTLLELRNPISLAFILSDCMTDGLQAEACGVLYPPCPSEGVKTQICSTRCPLLDGTCDNLNTYIKIDCSQLTPYDKVQLDGRCLASSVTLRTESSTEKTSFTNPTAAVIEDSPCDPNPCKNGGVCFPQSDEFFCLCVVGFLGKTCDGDTMKMTTTSRRQITTGATTTNQISEAQSTTPKQNKYSPADTTYPTTPHTVTGHVLPEATTVLTGETDEVQAHIPTIPGTVEGTTTLEMEFETEVMTVSQTSTGKITVVDTSSPTTETEVAVDGTTSTATRTDVDMVLQISTDITTLRETHSAVTVTERTTVIEKASQADDELSLSPDGSIVPSVETNPPTTGISVKKMTTRVDAEPSILTDDSAVEEVYLSTTEITVQETTLFGAETELPTNTSSAARTMGGIYPSATEEDTPDDTKLPSSASSAPVEETNPLPSEIPIQRTTIYETEINIATTTNEQETGIVFISPSIISTDRHKSSPITATDMVNLPEVERSTDLRKISTPSSTLSTRTRTTKSPINEPLIVTGHPNEFEEELKSISTILAKKNITEEDIKMAAKKVTEISRNDTFLTEDPERVELVIKSLESIVDTGYTTENVTEPVIEIINNLMDVDEKIINQGTSQGGRAVAALEELVTNVQENKGNVTIVRKNVGVVAVKVEKQNIGGNLVFAVAEDSDRDEDDQELTTILYDDGDEIPATKTTTTILVPREVIDSFDEGEANSTAVPISFIIYTNDVLFTPSMPSKNYSEEQREAISEIIISHVISARIEGKQESRELPLKSPIVATFVLGVDFEFNETTTKHCVLWDYNAETREGSWTEDGCEMVEVEANHTVCECERFASFAILVRVDNGDVVLYYITLIGSIVSGICLVMCLITFFSLKSLRSKQPTHIHINLCGSLLGFYVAFMLSIPAARDANLCKTASVAIHFFSLATVSWMTAEAVNMYFLFVKMERRGIKYFIPVACVLTYGLSAVCVVVTVFLDKQTQFESASYCFIQPGNALYFGFLTEVAVLFVINFLIFVWIIRKMLCRPLMVSKTDKTAKRKEIVTRVRHGILFWFVLGLSWFFGFLSAITLDSKTFVFDYLYCVFTALQGLMMFLLLCVANPEFRKVFSRFSKRDVSQTDSSNLTASRLTTRRTSESQIRVNPREDEGQSV